MSSGELCRSKNVFDVEFKQNIGKTTFRNICQNKNSIISQFFNHSNKNAKRVAVGKYKDVEEALKIWIDVQEARDNPINDDLITQKATIFGKEFGIENFTLSKGTLCRFKNRCGFKSYNAVGEMAEVNLEDFEASLNGIKVVLKDYKKKDVFNMDETGLYWRMLPAKSISSAPIKGFKKLLSRITVAFTVSAGGEKFIPLVIGNAAKPRALVDFKTSLFVDYTHSKKSWMTSSIFKSYLEKLNGQMKAKNRKILLLVDNCPAHKVLDTYSHVKVVFLPPNTTGVIQPLDLGVIRSFKCKFRKFLARHIIHLIDSVEDLSVIDAYKRISIRDAIFFHI